MFRFIALTTMLFAISLPSSAAVLYRIEYPDTVTTGGVITFSRSLPDFLPIGGQIEFGLSDVSENTDGTITSVTNSLILTQNAAGVTLDTAEITLNPGITVRPFVFIKQIQFRNENISVACPQGQVCSQTFSLTNLVWDEVNGNLNPLPDGRGNNATLTISGSSEVPEPSTVLLCGAAIGILTIRLRRR